MSTSKIAGALVAIGLGFAGLATAEAQAAPARAVVAQTAHATVIVRPPVRPAVRPAASIRVLRAPCLERVVRRTPGGAVIAVTRHCRGY